MDARFGTIIAAATLFGVLFAAAPTPTSAADTASLWRSLGWFTGHWHGSARGLPGEGRGSRCYTHVVNDRFLYARSETRFRPQPETPHGAEHQEWQFFSRDLDRDRILLRRFGSGGQVSAFVLDTAASRSDRFVFESVHFDHAPAHAHGRLTLSIGRGEGFRERLELGASPDNLEQVLEGRWQRLDHDADGCAPAPLQTLRN